MSIVVYPNVAALANVNLMRTDLLLSEVLLFKNDVIPGAATVLADLEEADFSGYAREEIAALLPAYLDPDGGASAQIATIQFDHTGGPVANTIYGFAVVTAGGAERLIGRFDAPVAMSALGQALPLDIKFNFGS